jgi:hypothetical protein
MVCRVAFTITLGLQAALGASGADEKAGREESVPARSFTAPAPVALPPVLRNSEPSDSVLVTLPGPAQHAVLDHPAPLRPFVPPATPAPAVEASSPEILPEPLLEATFKTEPLPEALPAAEPHPFPRVPTNPLLPGEFARDSAIFCQKRIGEWTQPDAYNLLGEATRERPAISDDKENGRIYAFNDPTGHYRELELDFASSTGLLRTVFVYPWRMTWADCRRLWGANVNATRTNKGRTFYSYLNRRLDVLVDPDGKVISLGLY